MYLQSKEELKRYLGSKPWFKKLLKTENVLEYVSGIPELSAVSDLKDSFRLVRYPKGIAFIDKKQKYQLGLSFQDFKKYKIIYLGNDRYELHLASSLNKSICFTYEKKHRYIVIPFLRDLPVKEEGDTRDDETARKEISNLIDEFSEDRVSISLFSENLKSVAKKTMHLDINASRIIWGDKEVAVSSAIGYSIGINEVNINGVSNFDYNIIIHVPDNPFYISFSTLSYFHKVGEKTGTLEQINRVLFDVISRPIITKWLRKIENNETIDFKEFSLSRQGLLLKTRVPNIMIHWDELTSQNQDIVRWVYTNTVFLNIESNYDRRGNMLYFLINWIKEDKSRSFALMGRNYLD